MLKLEADPIDSAAPAMADEPDEATNADQDATADEEVAASRFDQDPPAQARPVPVTSPHRLQTVFVPLPNYLQHIDTLQRDQRVWLISGPGHSGKLFSALRLGLDLLQQGSPFDRDLYHTGAGQFFERDLAYYEAGITALDQGLEQRQAIDTALRLELDSFKMQLREVPPGAATDDENTRAARRRILNNLNYLSITLLNMRFAELCRNPAVVKQAVPADQPLPPMILLRRERNDGVTLYSLVDDCDPQQATIFVVEQAFEQGLDPKELNTLLSDRLAESGSYLVLTTSFLATAISAIVPSLSSASISTSCDAAHEQRFLKEVLDRHLMFYHVSLNIAGPLLVQVEQHKDDLVPARLRRPDEIDAFCKSLAALPADSDSQAILRLADQIGSISRQTSRAWFNALSGNERLYALLAFLLPDIAYHQLDDLYVRAIRYLRRDGVGNVHDPREFGFLDMRIRIRADDDRGQVRFYNQSLVNEVDHQVSNYHHMLWSICERVLVPLIYEYEAADAASFRQQLGRAIGRLATYYLVRLEPLLDQLAGHPSSGVVATTGYLLDGLVRHNPGQADYAVQTIQRWVRSRNPDYMWAAPVVLWRVYDAVLAAERNGGPADTARQLLDSLSELAGSYDHFQGDLQNPARVKAARGWSANIRSAITYALEKLARRHSQDVVALLKNWLQTPAESNQHRLGRETASRLFNQPLADHGSRTTRLLIERHKPLLKLIAPMLNSDTRAIRKLLAALGQWSESAGWDTHIYTELHAAITQAGDAERAQLLAALSEEWIDARPGLYDMARWLIIRARLIEGSPADCYDTPAIRVIVDQSAPPGRPAGFSARLAAMLAAELAAIGPVAIANFHEAARHPADVASNSSIVSGHRPPRLVLPILEQPAVADTPLVLILNWGPVLDLEDAGVERWQHRLLLASNVGPDTALPPNIRHIPLTLSADQRRAADRKLIAEPIEAARQQLYRRLARRTANGWWLRLKPQSGQDPPNIRQIEIQLETWIAQLNDPVARPEDDPLRAIIATMSWLAAYDLTTCVELVQRWLLTGEPRHQLAGAAAGRALFYLQGSALPAPAVDRLDLLLRLVEPLGTSGRASYRAILFAVRRWLRRPELLDRLLARPAGNTAELWQMIEGMDAEDRAWLLEQLQAWDQPLPEDEPAQTPKIVAQLRRQIEQRMRLGAERELPALTAGQAYAVIVVDTSAGDQDRCEEFATIAGECALALQQHYATELCLLTFRLGRRAPLDEQAGLAPVSTIAANGRRPARLIGPLLERLPPAATRFVLFLRATPAHDEADWMATEWGRLIHVFSGSEADPASENGSGAAIIAYLTRRYPQKASAAGAQSNGQNS